MNDTPDLEFIYEDADVYQAEIAGKLRWNRTLQQ